MAAFMRRVAGILEQWSHGTSKEKWFERELIASLKCYFPQFSDAEVSVWPSCAHYITVCWHRGKKGDFIQMSRSEMVLPVAQETGYLIGSQILEGSGHVGKREAWQASSPDPGGEPLA